MKGIILAGGTGSRLFPITKSISKQLLPVYDKPMIYYPLCSLLLAGIKEILIITAPEHMILFQMLLKDGSQWGIRIQYAIQPRPEGIPQAFIIGEHFIGQDNVCLILGDNLLYGDGLQETLESSALKFDAGGTIFSYPVRDPERYGIVELNEKKQIISLEEKPRKPKSNLAVIGLYQYDYHVIEMAKKLKPSNRNELEITDINRQYLQQNCLQAVHLGRGMAWLDTGTPDALLDANHFIHVLETRQGLKICCPEEIAWRMKYIDDEQFLKLATEQRKTTYGSYLLHLLNTKVEHEHA